MCMMKFFLQCLRLGRCGTGKESSILAPFLQCRTFTETLCEPLEIEDYVVQPIHDVSPIKWHLAHTTWFFETFVLSKYFPSYTPFHPSYSYLFNSYYNAIGHRISKPERGTLSRPTIKDIYNYRRYVNRYIQELCNSEKYRTYQNEIDALLEIGIHHEQQHQELLMYDIKYIFFINPLFPIYQQPKHVQTVQKSKTVFYSIDEGVYSVGKAESSSFGFDNEYPVHKVFLNECKLANQLVTQGEYLAFIEDRGYQNPLLWLDDGWAWLNTQNICSPLYWKKEGSIWKVWTFYGWETLQPEIPVSHLSYYEADAFARWAGKRLPTEFEWEVFSQKYQNRSSAFIDTGVLEPQIANGEDVQHLYGTLWQWTASSYSPYPNYKQAKGAIGEYNGKFMINQMVLRGGSCVTSKAHFRPTYRNFFQPDKRWLFNGIRLAE